MIEHKQEDIILKVWRLSSKRDTFYLGTHYLCQFTTLENSNTF